MWAEGLTPTAASRLWGAPSRRTLAAWEKEALGGGLAVEAPRVPGACRRAKHARYPEETRAEALRLLGLGKPTREIARALGLPSGSVVSRCDLCQDFGHGSSRNHCGHGKPFFGRLGPLEEQLHGPRRYLVADGGVGPFAVVVGLDELDHRVPGVGPAWRSSSRRYISFFSVAKNDSATALSWQLPVRLQERRTSLARAHSASRRLVYWAPLSEWNMAFPAT